MNSTKHPEISRNELMIEGKILPLMEEFYTIQGEGFHTGKAAYFIRIGGCDVGCHWCDVKESWNAQLHPLTPVEKIILNACENPSKAVVVTGGEPLQYNLIFLTDELKKKNISTFLETSGAFELSGKWDWICLSPKKNLPPKPEIFNLADELKVIIHNRNDFKWAELNKEKIKKKCYFFLQPEWSKREELMPLITDYVMKNPEWMISLQTHKYMHIP